MKLLANVFAGKDGVRMSLLTDSNLFPFSYMKENNTGKQKNVNT